MHFIPFIRPFVFCSLSVLCLAKHKEKFGKAQDSFFLFRQSFYYEDRRQKFTRESSAAVNQSFFSLRIAIQTRHVSNFELTDL